MAVNPIEKDAVDGPSPIEISRTGRGATGSARPRHRRFKQATCRFRMKAHWLGACRSLLRFFGSIQCSIRCAAIRASKNSARKSSREAR